MMLLVSFLNYQTDSKKLLKTIKKYGAKKLLLIDFKDISFDKIRSTKEDEAEIVLVEPLDEEKPVIFKVLDSLKMDYEHLEISSSITHLSLIALLTLKIVKSNSIATIDVSNCPKTFLPIVLQSAYYIPESIKEIVLNIDEFGSSICSYPVVVIDSDPDKETTLLKEILSLFLINQEKYSDLSFNKTLSSSILLQLINDDQIANGQKEFKYPYIQACLSQLSQEQKGKVIYLQKRHNSSDKRSLVYTITDYGVLTLFIWFLNQFMKNEENSFLYKKLGEIFKEISFSEILYEYHSISNNCSVCGQDQLAELFTCSLCGQESCKNCLDDHYLNNDCHQQLQIAQN